MTTCPACASEVAPGQKFCGECGTPLLRACRTCGSTLTGGRFCTECGTPVEAPAVPLPAEPAGTPETERRLCSVLFVDLVGFTPLSEGRDPEEVRELLSRYFEIARTVVSRYGGLIEKFIGDAVMAVWGTPVAVEGDAERAVRAAMELVLEVAELGAEVGATGLAARAGVVTGTVAATLGAQGQAMVAGDAVNTAARIQSAAPAGGVLVDTTTRRIAGLAIEFDLHGDVELKGKAEPETLWRAREVVSGVGGAQRSDGLEAPFVGRSVEFGLLKDLLHATSRDRRPRLVLVSGPAGVGKSRLGWELEKYVDGLAETVYWHRGSCPRFGEDTAYWALTEIVRARLGIGDDDDRTVIEGKLAAYLARLFPDPADRAYVAARIAPLLGLPAGSELSRAELFAGWRRFFEGLAQQQTVLLLVEDLHDADPGLLDFLEHLVDWVRDLPVLVIGFARPDVVEERPGLGAGRNRTLISLPPLADADMQELLAGLVEEMPWEAVAAIESQAQGIPLFAVETVRSLIDQQVVVRTGEGYVLKGDVGKLSVPDSLHALLAARLDALDPVARSLAADAAVIAAPFTVETLVEVSGLEPAQVQAGLAELAHRDVLQVSADALSPQIGSYSFTHGLLAQVAYQTLSRRDLKERHLRVADHLAVSTRNDGDALAEVIARHHLDALEARPNDDDVDSLRSAAVEWLVRAADRASSTGAQATAARLFESAAELTGEADEAHALRAADLWMHAARAAYEEADYDRVLAAASQAERLREQLGRTRLAAVVQALKGRALRRMGLADEARQALVPAFQVLLDEPGQDTVEVANALAGVDAFSDDRAAADAMTLQAISLAETLGARQRHLAEAFNSRALFLGSSGRRLEAIAHFRQSIALAEVAGDLSFLPGPLGNLADAVMFASPREALDLARRAQDVARQVGSRFFMAVGLFNGVMCQIRLGQWQEAAEATESALDRDGLGDIPDATWAAAIVWTLRGDPARAREVLRPLGAAAEDHQGRAYDELIAGFLSQAEGDSGAALANALAAVEALGSPSIDPFVLAWPLASRLAHDLGDSVTTRRLLTMLDASRVGEIPPLVRAERKLAQARLVEDAAGRLTAVEDAVADLRAEGSPYHLALALLDLAEAQVAAGKDPADVVAEATSIGAVLGSPAVIARAERLS